MQPMANFVTSVPKNLGKLLRNLPSMTTKVRMTQVISSRKYGEVIDIEVLEQSEGLGDEGIEEEVDENELDRSKDDSLT
nr:hypothetical protein [Tanacetum cinerariifolium]